MTTGSGAKSQQQAPIWALRIPELFPTQGVGRSKGGGAWEAPKDPSGGSQPSAQMRGLSVHPLVSSGLDGEAVTYLGGNKSSMYPPFIEGRPLGTRY